MSETFTLNDILNEFLDANQALWTKLEQLGLTMESVEILMIPVERRMLIRCKEYRNNSLQTHQIDRGLVMQEVDFDASIRQKLPPGTILRGVNFNNLTPEVLGRVLTDLDTSKENTNN